MLSKASNPSISIYLTLLLWSDNERSSTAAEARSSSNVFQTTIYARNCFCHFLTQNRRKFYQEISFAHVQQFSHNSILFSISTARKKLCGTAEEALSRLVVEATSGTNFSRGLLKCHRMLWDIVVVRVMQTAWNGATEATSLVVFWITISSSSTHQAHLKCRSLESLIARSKAISFCCQVLPSTQTWAFVQSSARVKQNSIIPLELIDIIDGAQTVKIFNDSLNNSAAAAAEMMNFFINFCFWQTAHRRNCFLGKLQHRSASKANKTITESIDDDCCLLAMKFLGRSFSEKRKTERIYFSFLSLLLPGKSQRVFPNFPPTFSFHAALPASMMLSLCVVVVE